MKKSNKQPWNPYPLGVLTFIRSSDLSRGAAHVLTVIAARSNYKGEVCAGHRGLVQDCKSSKDYVTDALAELYEKGIVQAHPRKRANGQADWRVINPIVLKSRTDEAVNNPTEQDYSEIQTSCPAGLNSPTQQDYSNPTEQDDSNPAQQGRTLQIKKNLTDLNLNLADVNLAEQEKKERKKAPVAPLPTLDLSFDAVARKHSPEASKIAFEWLLSVTSTSVVPLMT